MFLVTSILKVVYIDSLFSTISTICEQFGNTNRSKIAYINPGPGQDKWIEMRRFRWNRFQS